MHRVGWTRVEKMNYNARGSMRRHGTMPLRRDDIEAEQNVIIISIPTVFDPSLAPAGKHAVHVYCAANEPWALWEGLERGSAAYVALKAERAEPLWRALEKVRLTLCASCGRAGGSRSPAGTGRCL